MLSDSDKEKIRKEAREILDEFGKSLKGVKLQGEEFKKEVGGYREESHGVEGDEKFREGLFRNAPEKEGDCLVAEKKKW